MSWNEISNDTGPTCRSWKKERGRTKTKRNRNKKKNGRIWKREAKNCKVYLRVSVRETKKVWGKRSKSVRTIREKVAWSLKRKRNEEKAERWTINDEFDEKGRDD